MLAQARPLAVLFSVSAFSLLGCEPPSPAAPDGGATQDASGAAGGPVDSGVADAGYDGGTPDAGSLLDAGSAPDAGSPQLSIECPAAFMGTWCTFSSAALCETFDDGFLAGSGSGADGGAAWALDARFGGLASCEFSPRSYPHALRLFGGASHGIAVVSTDVALPVGRKTQVKFDMASGYVEDSLEFFAVSWGWTGTTPRYWRAALFFTNWDLMLEKRSSNGAEPWEKIANKESAWQDWHEWMIELDFSEPPDGGPHYGTLRIQVDGVEIGKRLLYYPWPEYPSGSTPTLRVELGVLDRAKSGATFDNVSVETLD